MDSHAHASAGVSADELQSDWIRWIGESIMCRNIRTLFNFEPPASEQEIREASLQFVRKLSGFRAPSLANQHAFDAAVEQITLASRQLMVALVTNAPPKDRARETQRLRERSVRRFGRK